MKPWKVRKPDTITLDGAIKAFIKHRARGVSPNIPCRALLHDGSLLDRTLSIAQLGLRPDDMVELHWSTESEDDRAIEPVQGRKVSEVSSRKEAGNRRTDSSTAASPITTAAAANTTAAGSASTAATAVASATNTLLDGVKGMP